MAAQVNEANNQETKKNDDDLKDAEGLSLGVHVGTNNRVKISVIPPPSLPKKTKRVPAIVCCVVDVSGSMGLDAVIKDEKGNSESHGFCILDLVKHAIKTIIHCLSDTDYLSIVSYSAQAKVVSPLTPMTQKNRNKVLKALDTLQPDGQTNLYDGLYVGLEQLRKSSIKQIDQKNAAVMLFTDGMPNVSPPKGELGSLQTYIDEHQTLVASINTYGFGYSLDTKLLNDLATAGNGSFAFIPDSSFVGTIFVNSISNLCSNVAKDVTLSVECDRDNYDVAVLGGYKHVDTSWGVQLSLGSVQYGQNKDVVLEFAAKNPADDDEQDNDIYGDDENEGTNDNNAAQKAMFNIDVSSLRYVSLRHAKAMNAANTVIDDDDKQDKLTQIHYYRLLVCDTIRECMASMQINDDSEAQQQLKDLIKTIKNNKVIAREKYVSDLLQDLTGQVFEALSKRDFYDKWGKHYLPSLINAHLHQFNNNFKDPGVQHYGGELFQKVRNRADQIFIKLPAPKPSNPPQIASYAQGYGGLNAVASAPPYSPPVDMSTYYNASGGCIHGECAVLMHDGTYKMVKDVNVGDVVHSGVNGATVRCVIQHQCENAKIVLCNYGKLRITPFHPILIDGEWSFPNDIDEATQTEVDCEYVYNFVLDREHIMSVNGVQCCTLAHGLKTNAVIEHSYFGTDLIVDDLKRTHFDGWNKGHIVLNHDAFLRDENNLVYAIR